MEETAKSAAVQENGGLSFWRWALLVLIPVIGFIVIGLLLRELSGVARLASCRPFSITWVTEDYAKANAGMFPPLSSTPGLLMFVEGTEGEFFPSGLRRDFICEFDLQDGREVTEVPGAPLDDWSYVYLGYVIESQAQLELFAQAYKQIIAQKGTFTEDIKVAEGEGNCGTDTMYRFRDLPQLLETIPCLEGRLEQIPLVIEWPENHRGPVAKVITMANFQQHAGQTGVMPYPGEWPMTEAAIRVLRELDALGTEATAPPKSN
jgi:hypothetical protein